MPIYIMEFLYGVVGDRPFPLLQKEGVAQCAGGGNKKRP